MASPTSWKLYAANEEAWYSMLTACAHAKKSIVLEQFIFVNDDFGQKLINVCAERAAAGVKVRFLWDAMGSFTFFGTNIIGELKAKGIELLFWKTLVPGYFKVPNFRSWYLRNHRRTLVIDDEIGYTGSICVMDKLKNWRDTNVKLEGPVVREMSNAFERMWSRARKSSNLPTRVHVRDPEFRYVTNYPAPGRRHINNDILSAIRSSQKFIYITTPYFVPTLRLARSIRLASERGVDVRLLIPENSNSGAVDIAARSYFTSMLESGVRIFLYTGNMIHSKTMVVDGDWATVGSLNLDSVSLLYNFEANIITFNHKFAKELMSHFMEDVKESKEVNLKEWRGRFFIEKIPEILIKVVRKFL